VSEIFILCHLFLFLFEVTSPKCHQKLFDDVTFQISYYVHFSCLYWVKETQDVITYLIIIYLMDI